MKNRPFKKSLIALATSAALLAAGSVALAGGEDPGAWKIGGGGMWLDPESDRGLDDGGGYEIMIGMVGSGAWDWDLSYCNSSHDITPTAPGRASRQSACRFPCIRRPRRAPGQR